MTRRRLPTLVACVSSALLLATMLAERLGPLTSKASGLLVMVIVGGAIVPWLRGKLADHTGIQRACVIPQGCHAFIAWSGPRGSRPGDNLPPPFAGSVAGPAH